MLQLLQPQRHPVVQLPAPVGCLQAEAARHVLAVQPLLQLVGSWLSPEAVDSSRSLELRAVPAVLEDQELLAALPVDPRHRYRCSRHCCSGTPAIPQMQPTLAMLAVERMTNAHFALSIYCRSLRTLQPTPFFPQKLGHNCRLNKSKLTQKKPGPFSFL